MEHTQENPLWLLVYAPLFWVFVASWTSFGVRTLNRVLRFLDLSPADPAQLRTLRVALFGLLCVVVAILTAIDLEVI